MLGCYQPSPLSTVPEPPVLDAAAAAERPTVDERPPRLLQAVLLDLFGAFRALEERCQRYLGVEGNFSRQVRSCQESCDCQRPAEAAIEAALGACEGELRRVDCRSYGEVVWILPDLWFLAPSCAPVAEACP